jgi:cold shock CspA family protein/ribosome-associated translation inhibitor RaiA
MMPLQPQITFRNLDRSESVVELIEKRAVELEHFFKRIVACKVVVEIDHHRQGRGKLFHVSVQLLVPGGEIVVRRDPAEHRPHEDIRAAVKDAFDAARRSLEDYVRKLSGRVKEHEVVQEIGRIARLFPDEGYGFIAGRTGDEVYLHQNAVVGNNFSKLRVGDEVRYVVHDGEGEKGPQASTVIPNSRNSAQLTR